MAPRIDLTLDCANPTRLAEFWRLALGYEDEPVPAPYRTREEWAAALDPDGDAEDGAWLRDPPVPVPAWSCSRCPRGSARNQEPDRPSSTPSITWSRRGPDAGWGFSGLAPWVPGSDVHAQ